MLCIWLVGCHGPKATTQIVATTLPVYEFTNALCDGTGIQVTRLITESVSCLHDYTLQVSQMRTIESAELVVISGGGLEDFMGDMLDSKEVIDASLNIDLLCQERSHTHDPGHDHHHDLDPHIWLNPALAQQMVHNIYNGLVNAYPEHMDILIENRYALDAELEQLTAYGAQQLSSLSSRELITFHDGFSYMADAFDLEIIHAIEEESGSEASAHELIELAQLIRKHNIKAIFAEENGSVSAASVIATETGATMYRLDMAMANGSYFDSMYHNINTLKEALE